MCVFIVWSIPYNPFATLDPMSRERNAFASHYKHAPNAAGQCVRVRMFTLLAFYERAQSEHKLQRLLRYDHFHIIIAF